jgi:hypothetical protein
MTMGQKSHDAEASKSWKTLRAFLWSVETSEPRLPGYRCWKYLAGNNEPDFIWPEGKMAVELTGWIDEAKISKGKALEEFNRTMRTVLLKEPKTFKALEGHWVYLEALQPPERNWDSVTRQMLIYLADLAATLRDVRLLHLKNSELPQEMRAMFREAMIYKMPGSPSVSVVPKRDRSFLEQSYDAEKAAEQHLMQSVESFKNNLTKKMGKAEKYRSIGKALGFAEVWLVIHYDDTALEWAAPWVPVQFSYGPDSHESQRKLAQRARTEVWSDLQHGHFDKVYLLSPDQPRPFAERLWP